MMSNIKHDFMTFYNWAMDNGYKEGLTIDRKIQNRNTRRNHYITINGETHCASEWCEILGLKYTKVIQRINRHHWPIEQALELEERCCD